MVVLGPPLDGDESRKTSSHPVLDSEAQGSRGPFLSNVEGSDACTFSNPTTKLSPCFKDGLNNSDYFGPDIIRRPFLSSGETHVVERKVFSELGHGVEDAKFGFTHRKRSSSVPGEIFLFSFFLCPKVRRVVQGDG